MATAAWFVTNVLPILLAALAHYFSDRQAQAQAHADAEGLGAARTAAAVNKDTSDATDRAADAQINADAGSVLDDLLVSGGKQF
jgi:hypothetical protein